MSGKNENEIESPEPDIPADKSNSIELIATKEVIVRPYSYNIDLVAEKEENDKYYDTKEKEAESESANFVAVTTDRTRTLEGHETSTRSTGNEDFDFHKVALETGSPALSHCSVDEEKLENMKVEDRETRQSKEIETAEDNGEDKTEGKLQVQNCQVLKLNLKLSSNKLTQVPLTPTSPVQGDCQTESIENFSPLLAESVTSSTPFEETSHPEDTVEMRRETSPRQKASLSVLRSTSETSTSSITTSTTVTTTTTQSDLAGEKEETLPASHESLAPVLSESHKVQLQGTQITGKNLEQSGLKLNTLADTETRPAETNIQEISDQHQDLNKPDNESSRLSSPCCQCCCIGDCCCNNAPSDTESDEDEESCAACFKDFFSFLPFVKVRRRTTSNSEPSKPLTPLHKEEDVVIEKTESNSNDNQEEVSMNKGKSHMATSSENKISDNGPSSPPPLELKVDVVEISEVEAVIVPEVSREKTEPKNKEPPVQQVKLKTEEAPDSEKRITPTVTPDTLQIRPVGTVTEGKKENETFSFKGIMNLFSVYKQMLLTPSQDAEEGRETPTENVVVDQTPSPVGLPQEKPAGIVTQISDPDVFERRDESDKFSVTTTSTDNLKSRGLKHKVKNWFNLRKAARKVRRRYKSRDSVRS
ncbi:hypothetical protein ACHWQZ_G017080 [Mnemiopsis leidyi]